MFIDNFSRYVYVYLLRTRDKELEAFKEYRVEVENQTRKKIRSGGLKEVEYASQDFESYYKKMGIVHFVAP